jgi:hypothetical protein
MEEMLLFWLIDYKMAQKTLSAGSLGKSNVPREHVQHAPRYVFDEFPEICPWCESDAPAYVIFSFIPFAEMRDAGDKKQRSLLQTAKREQKEGKFMVPQPFYGCRKCLRERFLISYSEEAVKAIFDNLLLGNSNVTVIVKRCHAELCVTISIMQKNRSRGEEQQREKNARTRTAGKEHENQCNATQDVVRLTISP